MSKPDSSFINKYNNLLKINKHELSMLRETAEFQSLMLYWVSSALKSDHFKSEEDIVKYYTKKAGVSDSDIRKAIATYHYKSPNDEIPNQWISEFLHFVDMYLKSPNPSSIQANYLNKPLTYLSGIDLVSLEIALANKGKQIIKDFCRNFIRHNPVLGVVLDKYNIMHFPSYQSRAYHNWKFLYHLLYAYPEVGIIGGPYSYKSISGLEKHTSLSLFHHRKYLIEKALKGGGLAICLNVFNRIVVNPKFKLKKKTKICVSEILFPFDFDEYIPCSPDSQLKQLHQIPDYSDYFFRFFVYYEKFNLRYDCTVQYQELFEQETGIGPDENEYDKLFDNYMQKHIYKTMTKFIGIVRPLLPEYNKKWIEVLTYSLGMIASCGYVGCAEKVIKAGGKINLSGKVSNKKTCNVIIEALASRRNGIKVLIEIFQNANEDEFNDLNSKVNDSHIMSMFRYHPTSYQELKQLKSVLLSKDFVLSEEAKESLLAQSLQPY